VTHFITLYHSIRSNEVHAELQNNLIKKWSGENGMVNNTRYFICMFVVLLENNLLYC
jgi:hypothetical protein